MKVKEAIEIINNGNFDSLYEAEEAILDGIIRRVESEIDKDYHRLFTVSTNIYHVEDGYIGIRGISYIVNEDSFYYPSKACEYEKVTTISYRPKK